jgi:hypothetical protein
MVGGHAGPAAAEASVLRLKSKPLPARWNVTDGLDEAGRR